MGAAREPVVVASGVDVTTTAPATPIRYQRPAVYAKQAAALFHDRRYGIVEASTKAGKTVGCLIWLHEQAALTGGRNRNFWWVAPAYPQAKIAYRRLKAYLEPGSYTSNEAEVTITLLNGSVIWFKSGDNPDALYGEDVYAAVVDEATRVKAGSWHALRSTLTATKGPVRIIGNVKGRKNWAYRLARHAETGDDPSYHYAKLTAYDAAEAFEYTGVTMAEIRDAETVLPPDVFKELYLAEPAADSEAFFHVNAAAVVADWPRHARVCRAWDLAASETARGDYTAGVKMAHDGTTAYVLDVVRDRLSPDAVDALVLRTAMADGADCVQVFEEEKGAAGKVLGAAFKRALRGTGAGRVESVPVSGSKIARAFPFASAWNHGRVNLVRGAWLGQYLEEHEDFPDGDLNDDQVDAGAYAFNFLAPSAAPRFRWID